jgi:hypothetical protein
MLAIVLPVFKSAFCTTVRFLTGDGFNKGISVNSACVPPIDGRSPIFFHSENCTRVLPEKAAGLYGWTMGLVKVYSVLLTCSFSGKCTAREENKTPGLRINMVKREEAANTFQ